MNKVKICAALALLFAVIAVGLFTEIPSYVKYKNGDVLDYSTLSTNDLQSGALVQGVIDDCDGSIAELEETNTIFGIPTSKRVTSQYYACYMYNGSYVIYETANADECSTLNKLEAECTAFYEAVGEAYDNAKSEDDVDLSGAVQPSTTLEITGKVVEMRDDLRDIFQEWYGEGFDTDCVTQYVIRRCDFSRFKFVIPGFLVCAVLTVVMLVLTVLCFIRYRRARQFSY